MFVWNVKINFKKVLIFCIIVAIIIAVFVEVSNNDSLAIASTKTVTYDYTIDEANFTTMLKNIHENIDANLKKTVKITGFVFRMPDFKDTSFVCGRDMKLSGEDKVVGFLCDYSKAKDLKDGQWVEVTGVIVKGTYQTELPIIQVKEIKTVSAPENTYVQAPTNTDTQTQTNTQSST